MDINSRGQQFCVLGPKEQFQRDIKDFDLISSPAGGDIEHLVAQYNMVLCGLVDDHAPKKTRNVVLREKRLWFNEDTSAAKQQLRKCERRWRVTRTHIHRQMYQHQRNYLKSPIDKAKAEFYRSRIHECASDCKSLFKVMDGLLHRNPPQPPIQR